MRKFSIIRHNGGMEEILLLSVLGPVETPPTVESIDVLGQPIDVLPSGTCPPGLAIGFEEAAEQLRQLPGMFFEPDGAFFWRCPRSTETAEHGTWLVEGELYDGGPALHHVVVRLRCEPPRPWQSSATPGRTTELSDPAGLSAPPEFPTMARGDHDVPVPFDRLLPCFGIHDRRATIELPAIGCYAQLQAFTTWFQLTHR